MDEADRSSTTRFNEPEAFRDLLRLPHLAPLRWAASAPDLNWQVRKAAAKICMTLARRKRGRARRVAVDHSLWCSSAVPAGGVGPIWQYWAQGADQAPPLVKACLRSVARHKGERELIVLDDKTVGDHVDLPGHVWDKRRLGLMTSQHFSNFVRLSLLFRHGGTWLDATILLRQAVPAEVEREDFYILRETNRHPRLVETWFIHARRNHPLIETVLHGLADYWRKYDQLHNYFMFPYHFEASLLLHRQLRCDFLRMPQVGADRPHELQRRLFDPFDEAAHRALFDDFWLHKLTRHVERPPGGQHLLWDAIMSDRLAGAMTHAKT
ncbi:capsular polysaccharide synthesis protein [Mesorhizobium comanense]|uniref:capsular polysaccharide synthesis protein n=1 Tax=Mesorhizobium comanense TaxID=2502215 RepID=UPI0010F6DB9D|nr:capsular polysaccharide synthesis protein [Mesorhizobium comanense]